MIVAVAACLTSLIFQQYRIGFRVELNNETVDENVQATRKDGRIPMFAIKIKTIPTGR